MRAMPFEVLGQGVLDVVVQGTKSATPAAEQAGDFCWSQCSNNSNSGKRKRDLVEPRSVLDQRRSPSPPTSTSTLSSSLGGGGGGAASSDTAGVAAVSDSNNPPPSSAHHHKKWPPSSSDSPPPHIGADTKKEDEWATELQPIPAGLDLGLLGGEKCGGALGSVDDWEAMLGDPTAAAAAVSSPPQEQTFLRWIMGDMEDPFRQQHAQHLLYQPPVGAAATASADLDVSSAALGFGLVDPGGFGFDAISTIPAATPAINNSHLSSTFPLTANASRVAPLVQQQFPGIKVPCFGNVPTFPALAMHSLPLPPAILFQDPAAVQEKPLAPHVFGPTGRLLNQSHTPTNPSFFLPVPELDHGILLQPPQPKRHHALTLGGGGDGGGDRTDMLLRRNQPPQIQQLLQPHQQQQQQLHGVPYQLQHRLLKTKAHGDEAAAAAAQQQQQQQALVDQLFKAAELVETGNFEGARGILARLNQLLPLPIGKPLDRSAFYFKEALQHLLDSSSNSPHRNSSSVADSPLDVVLKLSAYKAFSEVSPVIQFTNFTCVQTLLEELGPAERIHIIDFDIGVGGHWSSFMQELAQRRSTSTSTITTSTTTIRTFLKITSFVFLSSHHPIELHLIQENLSHFAADLNIPFEFNVFPLEAFDPVTILAMSGGADEAVAVNLPVGYAFIPSIPTILHLVKQLSPKIVVSVDQGCDRSDLQFSHHFLHALQSSVVLLDSIDAAGTIHDVANKIERYLLQPRIEKSVLGRHRNKEKLLPWKSLFMSAGFVPVQFSNFTETQAECILKRVQVKGFHAEKRQASLFLYWQRSELASVSAWRC